MTVVEAAALQADITFGLGLLDRASQTRVDRILEFILVLRDDRADE
jgi:hypothetical protein